MKSKLFLLALFSVIFCSQPFLRKLEEVTEATCKAEKKKYQAAVPAKCKIGDTEYEVEKESECKAGTWTSGEVCSAKDIKKEYCEGIPTYTEGTPAQEEKCELNGVKLSLSQANCEVEVVWINGICDGAPQAQSKCTAEGATFTNGLCKSTSKTSGECDTLTAAGGVCIDTSITTSESCGEGFAWIDGVCSVSEITDSDKCKGTPEYTAAKAKQDPTCTIKGQTIPDRTTKDKCVEPLEWLSGSCSNKLPVKTEEDCKKDGTYTAGTPAKCVEDDSASTSSSNFLKAINFVLIAGCLLL